MTQLSILPSVSNTPQLHAIFDQLDSIPIENRISEALIISAQFLEYSAYEMAQSEEPKQVARLILMAADIERTARCMGEDAR